jgi:AcrR family transcriptional regulator
MRPTGRDEVRAAILDAAAGRFANEGTNASLRDIAADAGVNLGLIHRHFGNKDDLLRAVLGRETDAAAKFVADQPDLPTAARHIFESTRTNDRYIRTLAWLLLSETQTEQFQEQYPAIRALRDRADSAEQELGLLAALAMTYGWSVFGDQLVAAFGYPRTRRRAVEQHLGALAARLAASR